MILHSNQKCRRCFCQNKTCRRRRSAQRRESPCSCLPALYLSAFKSDARKRNLLSSLQDRTTNEEEDDVLYIDSHDLQGMRDSVDKMQQQLTQGLHDLHEIRTLMTQVAAQREHDGE